MNGRRAVIGLSLFCALAFSAFAAPSAFAIKGTTAFTCVKKAGAELRGEHCLTTGSAAQEYEHEAIEVNKAKEIEATNNKTAQTTQSAWEPLMTSTSGGIQIEVACETEKATGTLVNETVKNAEGKEYMRIHGEKTVITYENCSPKGFVHIDGCKLKEGTIKTGELVSNSKENTDLITFEPAAGTVFATLTLEGCKTVALNREYKAEGSANAIGEGATLRTSNLTTPKLTLNAQAAALISASTVSVKGGNPVSATTTTP